MLDNVQGSHIQEEYCSIGQITVIQVAFHGVYGARQFLNCIRSRVRFTKEIEEERRQKYLVTGSLGLKHI